MIETILLFILIASLISVLGSVLVVTVGSSASAVTGFGTIGISGITVTGTLNPPVASSLNLVSGNNTITAPAGAAGVVIVPPSANAVVLIYKTTSGDAGVAIPVATPSIFFFSGSPPATIYLNAASNTTGLTQLLYF